MSIDLSSCLVRTKELGRVTLTATGIFPCSVFMGTAVRLIAHLPYIDSIIAFTTHTTHDAVGPGQSQVTLLQSAFLSSSLSGRKGMTI